MSTDRPPQSHWFPPRPIRKRPGSRLTRPLAWLMQRMLVWPTAALLVPVLDLGLAPSEIRRL